MTTTSDAPRTGATRYARWGLPEVIAGLLGAVVLVLVLDRVFATTVVPSPVQLVGSYLAVWVPLVAAVLIASYARGLRSLVRDFGLRFSWLDLLWGLGLGFVVRFFTSLIELAVFGRMSGVGGLTFGEPVRDVWWVFGTILAPVLIAPFVEELFFRGLTLRALRKYFGGSDVGAGAGGAVALAPRVAAGVSIVVSAALFAGLHLVTAPTPGAAFVTAASTFVFGALAALLAVLTGRLGGAIVAHVAFNGTVVLAVLLAG